MSSLLDEYKLIQNPAIAAVVIWQFGFGFFNKIGSAPSLLYAFLVPPLIMHPYSFKIIASTYEQTGIAGIAHKLAFAPNNLKKENVGHVSIEHGAENLFSLNQRAIQYRSLSYQGLLIGSDFGLFDIDESMATFSPLNHKVPVGLEDFNRSLFRCSHKLGSMCADISLSKMARLLQVKF